MSIAYEVNFDGIVGPTHNYAGLSYGNVASMSNKSSVSNPRQAALEGLAKMKFLADLGVKQAVLPPHERPHLPTLRRLGYEGWGFDGSDTKVLEHAAKHPLLLASVKHASAMWAANAATVSPSAGTFDERVHFTPANLINNFHRSLETATTARILRTLFADDRYFVHHEPLPATPIFADEGAANHTRLGATFGLAGVELFTFGTSEAGQEAGVEKTRFPARQTLRASQTIAFMHRIKKRVFVRQNPRAIDAGAFHNDVVAVGNRNLLIYHEDAWVDADNCIEELENSVTDLRAIEIKASDIPLADAISSYLFNSQLVTLPDGSDALIAPIEAKENPRVKSAIDSIGIATHYVDVRQSMRNGGGPACLRLRVVLTDAELAAMHGGVMFSEALHTSLRDWITRHYREALQPSDLADPKLLAESRAALDELTKLLGLGSIYEFQR